MCCTPQSGKQNSHVSLIVSVANQSFTWFTLSVHYIFLCILRKCINKELLRVMWLFIKFRLGLPLVLEKALSVYVNVISVGFPRDVFYIPFYLWCASPHQGDNIQSCSIINIKQCVISKVSDIV